MDMKKVVIIGGGFGGLNCSLGLKRSKCQILMIDKTNHHVFQPLLYQVASAALSSENIAVPIRDILKKQQNTQVIMANIETIDKENKCVIANDGQRYPYDYLVLAPGARHSYFGHEEWEPFAPGLKTVEDALQIRDHVLMAFELAEKCEKKQDALKYLRFVIIGGGPTGVELAGAIAEISRYSLFKNFRRIRPEQSEIYLIEGLKEVLPSYPLELSRQAHKDLENMGVKVLTDSKVTNITKEGVYLDDMLIATPNVIWAAGNQASPLLKSLGIPLDRQGRALVESDLSLPGYPEIFCIGDAANFNNLPGIAPVAIQQGKYVASLIAKQIPKDKRKPFKYFDKGNMATIGRAKAVAVLGKYTFSGFIAWLAWGFIHILYLINFRNRLIVMMQWGFWYITGKRNVRLITHSIDKKNIKPLL